MKFRAIAAALAFFTMQPALAQTPAKSDCGDFLHIAEVERFKDSDTKWKFRFTVETSLPKLTRAIDASIWQKHSFDKFASGYKLSQYAKVQPGAPLEVVHKDNTQGQGHLDDIEFRVDLRSVIYEDGARIDCKRK
ncbi:hypothetical protein PsAD5_02336 [Pseudovibrio sp. Ad5]|uniref:hypothetical protein n=1 Tax=Pseudovibrio sp. Ad5 TaxID=989436 RepID=UPI0007AECED9|nr:hypothetical protein [Pseudovibrio sp. Ad5]KZK97247.1 hypothetical protein PsAD5_02336 [Pseudovibrio sp. Ad5]